MSPKNEDSSMRPQNDWGLYDKICKERFNSLDEKVDRLKNLYVGGLTGLVAVLIAVILDLGVNILK